MAISTVIFPEAVTVSVAKASHALFTAPAKALGGVSQPWMSPSLIAYTVMDEPEVSRNVLLSFTT